MAKNYDEENAGAVETFKTVKFGGYDKASVDYYIEDLKASHEKEVEELKANVNKLSEAVLSLKNMRELNISESGKTIDTLKEKNAELEAEMESLKEQVDAYKQREFDSAKRYESISRTLLEARESADTLVAHTKKKCEDMEAETTAKCEALDRETTEKCRGIEADTDSKCKAMYAKTESSCNAMKEQAYSESERLRNSAHEDAQALKAKTDYECKVQVENAEKEAESIKTQAQTEVYMLRSNVKKECESVSKYKQQPLSSLDGVVDACCSTKDVADKAFTGLRSEAADMVGDGVGASEEN